MHYSFLSIPLICFSLASSIYADASKAKKHEPLDASNSKSIPVKVEGVEFTRFVYQGVPKPVLFPIVGPHELQMTRNWPLAKAKEKEELDHAHHQSLWFAHGDVNGVDFWLNGTPKSGTVAVQGEPKVTQENGTTTIASQEVWSGPDGKKIMSSQTTIRCGGEKQNRWIDYTIVLQATESEVVLGDTKEGTMALRVRPELNLPEKKGVAVVTNSAGHKGGDVWGKKAAWVDYSGVVEGKTVGIACFDHPSNLRHPTTWHARNYGLFAANPFGLHDFLKAPGGAGKHTIAKGESLTFRYRWFFHDGAAAAADVSGQFAKWAAQK